MLTARQANLWHSKILPFNYSLNIIKYLKILALVQIILQEALKSGPLLRKNFRKQNGAFVYCGQSQK